MHNQLILRLQTEFNDAQTVPAMLTLASKLRKAILLFAEISSQNMELANHFTAMADDMDGHRNTFENDSNRLRNFKWK